MIYNKNIWGKNIKSYNPYRIFNISKPFAQCLSTLTAL